MRLDCKFLEGRPARRFLECLIPDWRLISHELPPIRMATSWKALFGIPELMWTPPLSRVVLTNLLMWSG